MRDVKAIDRPIRIQCLYKNSRQKCVSQPFKILTMDLYVMQK